MTTTDLIHIIGTAAFAISGYLVGVRKRLDMLGVIIVTLLTAIGGGMLRDVLIGRIPAVFTQHTALIVISVTLAIAWLAKLQQRQKKILVTLFLLADSLGLVAFTITGAQAGLALDLNLFGVVMLGFATAVGGGIIRDMLVNDIPMILRKDFYGSVAILIALALYGLHHGGWVNPLTLNILLWGGYALRLLAHYRDWHLPKF
ncbi:MAG: trimeric intracellular cation channel family protein [Cardiobacteriaceae bacterium]|nr:trimeric intracellular cation channel family protein [Cardiobacteriaceae bacterium]